MTLQILLRDQIAPLFDHDLRALAARVRVRRAHIEQMIAGTRTTADTSVCLRLAECSGVAVDLVLRVAGQVEDADIIERLYGPPHYNAHRLRAVRHQPTVTREAAEELRTLERYRLERGWSFAALADDMREAGYPISLRTLNDIATGKHLPYRRTQRAIRAYIAVKRIDGDPHLARVSRPPGRRPRTQPHED